MADELSWIQTHSGKRVDMTDLRDDSLDIDDIAHSLAHQARYNGHGRIFYSVAEHCVLMADWILAETGDAQIAYAGLMHDASEAYISDIPKPFKRFLTNYHELEHRFMEAIARVYGFTYPLPSIVKVADSRIVLDERVKLFETIRADWTWASSEPLGVEISGLEPEAAKRLFLERYETLRANA